MGPIESEMKSPFWAWAEMSILRDGMQWWGPGVSMDCVHWASVV